VIIATDHTFHLIALGLVTLTLTFLVAGRGGDEPAYCSELSDLEQSVNQLGDVDVVGGGTDAIREAVSNVEDDARATVDAAEEEFGDETRTVSDALSKLETSVRDLPESPTADQAAIVLADASAVATSVDELITATRSKCD
jgi:hypothetical protein